MLNRRNFLIQSALVTGVAGSAQAKEKNMAETSELEKIVRHTAWDQVSSQTTLTVRQRSLVEATALSSVGATRALRLSLEHSLEAGVHLQELYEAIVQSSPYAGAGRALDAQAVFQDVLREQGIAADWPQAGTVTDQNRLEKGLAAQTGIFGDAINRMIAGLAPDEELIMHTLLTGHCFGDFYTRKVFTLQERELLTFAAMVSIGGADPQVRAHVNGCSRMGYDRKTLLDVLAVLAPWIGFPRTLNGLAAVNEFFRKKK